MAKGRKTGGRQKGTRNRRTQALMVAVADSGITPLDYMLSVLRVQSASKEDRQWAAQHAAPYVHARLAAVEHSGEIKGDPLREPMAKINGRSRTDTAIPMVNNTDTKPNGSGETTH